ncbi:hypothetical protein [Streptomyces sp. NPDC001889]
MRRGRTATAGRVVARAGALRAGIVLGTVCALLQSAVTSAGASAVSWTSAYRTDPKAQAVRGSTDAGTPGPHLSRGTYTDTISAGQRKFYRVELDDTSNAYVSAVLAPPAGRGVAATDGIRVSLRSADGAECSVTNDITFGGATSLPTADYSTRRIGRGRECQTAGDYLYSVEWIGRAGGSNARGWTVELKYMTEPGLKGGGTGPSAPATWHSHTPDHVTGAAKGVTGGSGFNDASPVVHGVWKDSLGPGQSRFYKVPVDWGQQLFVDAEFGGVSAGQAAAVNKGVRVTVFNTARGFVEDNGAHYLGRPAKVSLATVPAAYANRVIDEDDTSAMRFSGVYYIRVALDRKVARSVPVTLRVGVEGERQRGPAYLSDPVANGFGISEEDREDALGEDDETRETLMTVVGFTGIGLGSALVLGLLCWTGAVRLGLGRGRGRHASPPAH